MATELDAIIEELAEADNEDRKEILIEFARKLPPLPDRFASHMDAEHSVPECQSPVFLFVDLQGDLVFINAYVPEEAPTARAFVSLLIEGLRGASCEDVLKVPGDLVQRSGLNELLTPRRASGLSAVLHRLKREVTKALIARASAPTLN